MNALDGVIENLDIVTFPSLEGKIKPINEFWERANNYFKKIKNAVEIYERTGVPPKCNFESWEAFEVSEDTRQRNSSKENVAPNENLPEGRSRKNSVRQAARNHIKKEKISIVNEEQSVDNEKMPAPSQPAPKRARTKKTRSLLQIKEEKLEEELEKQASDSRDSVIIEDVEVPVIDLIDSDGNEGTFTNEDAANKAETEEVPAATRASKRTKRKETASKIKIKKEKVETESAKKGSNVTPQDTTVTAASLPESDIEEETAKKKTESKRTKQSKVKIKKEKIESPKKALQDVTIVMVNLLDSDCNAETCKEKAVKSGPTKAKQKTVKKRTRSHSSSDGEESTEKRPKSDSENLQTEDVAAKAINNATFVSKSPVNKNLNTVPNTMNATVVVEKPKFVPDSNKLIAPATIDDLMTDDESDDDSKNVTRVVTKTATKAPKQGVGQHEPSTDKKKIGPETDTLPIRVTRTKTRAQAKDQGEVDAVEAPNTFTPVPSKLIPKAATTVVKKTLQTPQSSSSSRLISTKYGSELKASQAKDRELEKRREKKKEEFASIQAQLEERMKKKEKQLKVQQQREAWQRENQRQKEELVKKKLLKIQAIEEKKKEVLKMKKKEEVKVVQKQQEPMYMTTEPPLLPSNDCYDSDDERNKGRHIKEIPWARSGPLREMLYCMMAAGDTVKNSFFSRQAETPDLQEIFVAIKPEKLKRTSSAIWHKPPRYTMMPVLDQHFEDSEDDD